MSVQKIVFILLLLFCLTPFASPPIALILGLLLALTIGNGFPEQTRRKTRYLLQACVVLLGFGMNLGKVIEAGRGGILFALATIFGTLALGFLLGKILKINRVTSDLISCGTAICGGSAIAAIAPVVDADSEEISVSLGTIFILNSVALFVFPLVGHWLDLSQQQFGIWSAIAIHDTSSVVGATQNYGLEALQIATTVKLVRALWIAPLALLVSYVYSRRSGEKKAHVVIPWFILLFMLASIFRTYAPARFPQELFDWFVSGAKLGLTVTLFLIGSSLSRETIKKVGIAPLVQGILLWITISLVSLWAIMNLL